MAYRQKDYTYNNSLSKEENLLLDRLYKLKLSHMAEELERQFLNPNTELEDFHTRISAIINYEWDQRQTKKFNRLKTKATLKYPNVDFDQSLYEPDRLLDTHTIELLQKCDWIDEPKTCLLPVARVLARHISLGHVLPFSLFMAHIRCLENTGHVEPADLIFQRIIHG